MSRKLALLFSFFFLVSCSSPPQEELPTYRIGYMICNSEQETLDRFLPLTKYLGEKLGVNFEAAAIHTNDFMKHVDTLDFTHTNSLIYIMMQRFNGVEVLAGEKRGSLGYLSQGVIMALKTSGIETIEDLRGKSMVFGPMLAPTGFMSQIDLLEQNGIDPEEDLAFYTIPSGSFKHEKVIYGVMFEKYDAAAIPIFDVELMAEEGRIDPEEFVVIAEAAPIPYCNFGVSQKVDEQFAQRFKKTLLDLTMDDTVEFNGERVSVLARTLTDGFEELQDSDFDIVREMAKRTNMPPYQEY
ncbi:MAG: phosphate/phosphite/phosphonate ABC transporter substrate-binding protein [Desulfobulbaceae bacterium]|nr:phosphate/phosphite/phosphonate ABC transporter substrate-binding protein [Desulfobulbaceae bacterium]